MEKKALLLIDIQNDYFPGGRMTLVQMDETAARARSLLQAVRGKEYFIVHVQHIALDEKAPFFRPNTQGVRLHHTVEPLPEELVVIKHYPNAFRETRLKEILDKAGVTTLVICGAMSHMCIDATTRAAADFGYKCVVASDACTTRELQFEGCSIAAQSVHGAFMAALGSAYAEVKTLDNVLAQLEP